MAYTQFKGPVTIDTGATVQGPVDVSSTNPLPMAGSGVYNSTLPTYTSGQWGDVQLTARGAVLTTLAAANGGVVGVNTSGDGASSATGLNVVTQGQVFNGTTWDRQRGDTTGIWVNGPSGGPLPVMGSATTGTDRSITASTTSQQLMAANTARKGFYVKNDTAIDVYINPGATAVATAGGGNIKVAASGGYYVSEPTFPTSSAINIIAASGTPAVTAREF